MWHKKLFAPLVLPIHFFAAAILLGAGLLCQPISASHEPVSFLDALFTATSAACVTGLAVTDTGTTFTRFGHTVILALIQLGGLGIMTFSTLIFYLWRRRVSLADHIAVGQSLLHDASFHLGRFLTRMAVVTVFIEALGALGLYLFDPVGFAPFSAVFHSVSAFCNAGFGLFPDNLMRYTGHPGINLIIMWLIVSGGLGFAVLIEGYRVARNRLLPGGRAEGRQQRLSWYARTVFAVSAFLVFAGAAMIFCGEFLGSRYPELPALDRIVAALFQSVSCRTAGFNTLDIGRMADASLVIMILLMFIGGSPGSCAGGIKTTTFRVLAAFGRAKMFGRKQAVVGRFAVDDDTVDRAVTLTIFAAGLVLGSVLLMCFTEGAVAPHVEAGGRFLEILFEVVSAFGTVGLSTGITPGLSPAGKLVIIMLMFVGRLGPILFLSVLQGFQEPLRYRWPEQNMMIG
ncbi:Potassium uptake protein, integral membrane component, KtrB [Desulfovibrio sp. DV]|uniref:TrkH family potassium uptake protein n=1 Tax=Desulfovibrio sp. DV TaxID=1844708 RepID=UPI00094BB8CD|nr:potassium transporter TrkG [Desulfovibrio sp. DV]OLN25056.1 Potassium uptake protein, integral membrane component, KtrB [Desulfovibrio sp. DV]